MEALEEEYCITPLMERKPLLYSTTKSDGLQETEKPKQEPPRVAMPWLFERPNYVQKGFLWVECSQDQPDIDASDDCSENRMRP